MIVAEDLWFGYGPRSDPILRGFEHEFARGSVTVVTGASGHGKSTLLYLLGLLLSPVQGRVVIDGSDAGLLSDSGRSALRARLIGFVFQDAALDVTRSVLDNVVEGALYAGVSRRTASMRAEDLLRRFGVHLRAEGKPGEVSGGQAQRVGLCRALIKEPKIILADEPTGNLDAASSEVVLEALWKAAEDGTTVVVASHDPAVIARGSAVIGL